MARKKVVIIGAGFGGLSAAKALNSPNIDLLLINRTNHHLFQPLLYQVATASLAASEIAISIRRILRKQKNTEVIMGDVTRIDKVKNIIELEDGSEISFDNLIVATGARHSYFGNDQWEELAPGLKNIQDALRIRDEVLYSFEQAEYMAFRGDCPEAAIDEYTNFVIIGGGPTGVEMAGAIAEIAQKTLKRDFRNVDPKTAKIFLIEGSPRLLQAFPEKLSARAQKDLEKMGVKVYTSSVVTEITEDGVKFGDAFIKSKNIMWAAGNQASPLLKSLDVELDRQGRVQVESDLSIPGSPHIFVIGDAAAIPWKKGLFCPAIAPLAIQSGICAADYIRLETPLPRPPFVYLDKGSLATIGKGKAVGVVPMGIFGKYHMKGFLAWLAWGFIHIFYLVGFRNKLSVMLEWMIVFVTSQRGVRVIYKAQKKKK